MQCADCNHGVCAVTMTGNVCLCNEGWTGVSDFVNYDGINCNVSRAAMIGLYAVCLVFSAVASTVLPILLYRHVARAVEDAHSTLDRTRTGTESTVKRYWRHAQSKKTASMALFACASFCWLAFSIIKVSSNDVIGRDVGATITFGLAMSLMFAACYPLFVSWIRSSVAGTILSSSRANERTQRTLDQINKLMAVSMTIVSPTILVSVLTSLAFDQSNTTGQLATLAVAEGAIIMGMTATLCVVVYHGGQLLTQIGTRVSVLQSDCRFISLNADFVLATADRPEAAIVSARRRLQIVRWNCIGT